MTVIAAAAVTAFGLLAAPPGPAFAQQGLASAQHGTPSAQQSFASHPSTAGTRPSQAAETSVQTAITGTDTVTLVTGDKVRLTHYTGGRTTAAILPGSPDAGRRVRTFATPIATYVVPQLPVAEAMALDPSMFNVSALSRLPGSSVGVQVTFAKGVPPHAVPGLVLDGATARRLRSGETVVSAHYATSSNGRSVAGTWRGVASVVLPSGRPPAVPAGDPLHTLTINVSNAQGKPVRFEFGFVQNVDDARLFLQPVYIIKGVVKVSVPEGNYAAFAGSFTKIVEDSDFPVLEDTSITMNLADATVHPSESIQGYSPVDAEFDLQRGSAGGGGFDEGFGSDRYLMHVQPSPKPAHGTLYSVVSGTLVPTADLHDRAYPTAVYPKDYRTAVPADMSFTHVKANFAIVPQRLHANGPAGNRLMFTFSFAPFEFFGSAIGLPVHVPSVRTAWLQGNQVLTWMQDYWAITPSGSGFRVAELTKTSRYSPGAAQPVNFAHGPVGPGPEAAFDQNHTGRDCLLCRNGNVLHGFMPLFEGAGSGMQGALWASDMGNWTLSHGFRRLQSGAFAIEPSVTLPSAMQSYTLTADSHPGVASWQLSTDVKDSWHFGSQNVGDVVIPLLIPSYVPRTTLGGALAPGPTRFPLNFGNLGPVDATVTHATVSLSTDGGHSWHPATVTRTDKNSFAVTYTNPAASATAHTMSLRVTGVDAAHRSVSETALNVYHLMAGRAKGSGTAAAPVASPGARNGRVCATAPIVFSCYAIIAAQGSKALLPNEEPAGYGATDLEAAYRIPKSHSHETVAVVVAFDYPSAGADLNAYRKHFGLPPCTSESGCFTKINERGDQGDYPESDPGWSVEAALDMEMISAACPTCHIILAEADEPSGKDLAATAVTAAAAGAVVSNHSYGAPEHTGVRALNASYDIDGVTAVAATGDEGYGVASFPASSPDVIAVGGTVLHHAPGPRGWRENAWHYGGSGCSAYFDKPSYQQDTDCGMRTYADISAVAVDVAVYDTFWGGPQHPWLEVDGTSISSPLIAGMIGAAKAGGIRPGSLYDQKADAFHDVRLGHNGFCNGSYICTSMVGYDGPTGLGTPRGLLPFAFG